MSIGIAAKHTMSTLYNPDSYVTNGLVAMWDGEWNNGSGGGHSRNPSAWKDVINNVEIIPSNSSYYFKSKSAVTTSNGTGWYKDKLNVKTMYGQEVFIECAFIPYAEATARNRAVFSVAGDTSVPVPGQLCIVNNDTVMVGYKFSDSKYWRFSNISGKFNTMMTVSAKYLAGVAGVSTAMMTAWYINGQVVTQNSGTANSAGSNRWLHIGGSWAGLNGEIFCFRIYNRQLTADEVMSNYIVDKHRFIYTL